MSKLFFFFIYLWLVIPSLAYSGPVNCNTAPNVEFNEFISIIQIISGKSLPPACQLVTKKEDTKVELAEAIYLLRELAKKIWYKDQDDDGFGDAGSVIYEILPPNSYVENSSDCNDENKTIHPGAIESCGGNVDTNCDGILPQKCPVTWYQDNDDDGFATDKTLLKIERPLGYKLTSELTSTSGDCDDNNAMRYPGAPEKCGDNIDMNCDAVIPQKCVSTWYRDKDNDGYSNSITKRQIDPPYDFKLAGELVSTFGDCDDEDSGRSPGNKEITFNKKEDDCNVLTLDEPDITPPSVVSTIPPNNSKDISLTTTISLTFNETLKQTSISPLNFALLEYNPTTKKNNVVTGCTISNTGTTVRITPSEQLKPLTVYIIAAIDSVNDLAGNHLSKTFTSIFSTKDAVTMTSIAGEWKLGSDLSFTVSKTGDITAIRGLFPTNGYCFGNDYKIGAKFDSTTVDENDFSFSTNYSHWLVRSSIGGTREYASLKGKFTSSRRAEGTWSAGISNYCRNHGTGSWTAIKQ